MPAPARLAILPDFREEHWPSMDLCAEMLALELQAHAVSNIRTERVQPAFRWRLASPATGSGRRYNADRFLNRFWDYPRFLRSRVKDFDLFHVCDHSYAHLVHELPAERTSILCHDLDAFLGLLEPERIPRPRWFRAMAGRILSGLEKAAILFYTTEQIRMDLEKHGLAAHGKLVKALPGVAPEFLADSTTVRHETALAPHSAEPPFLLHVGSCIPRKRVDVLLRIFAAVRESFPELKLVKVGGTWSRAHEALIQEHHLASAIIKKDGVSRAELAALYRSAALVLQPSAAEGFGLPVIEALACGATVIASDIPALREAGGPAAVYCPAGNVEAWAAAVRGLLADPGSAPGLALKRAHALRFSWSEHAKTISSGLLALL